MSQSNYRNYYREAVEDIQALIASRVLIKHLLNPTFYLVLEECMYVTNPHFETLL
ncbi:hypothetical protein [Pseudanabaena sp. CCNP1317]|uniref:hypothetical protein n=1 Tax=Pseudanabaena sp. CCNP1317 TaxID=3110253 RepID=UPI002B21BE42|nr:hypothetical protein [Pseudanabaena sp. CCNP1317]MEA5488164.1 hypothetical protein [Pseudanabaena sp. CCNP1317]